MAKKKKEETKLTVFDKQAYFKKKIAPLLEEARMLCIKQDIPLFYGAAVKNDEKGTVYHYNGNFPGGMSIILKDDHFGGHFGVARGFEAVPPGMNSPFAEVAKINATEWSDLAIDGYVEELPEEAQ